MHRPIVPSAFKTHFKTFLICALLVNLANAKSQAQGLTAKEKFFERSVRPLLIEHCHECHGETLQESDLRLDSIDSVLQGGISGPAAIAENLRDSLIIRAVTGRGIESMPPDGPLEPEQIAILRRWVKMGLPWTKMGDDLSDPETGEAIPLGDQEAISAAAASHWAFQPMQSPEIPNLPPSMQQPTWDAWSQNPIDGFIARKLAENNLLPSQPASRATIVRRLYFDLIGLPPTTQQSKAFIEDARSDPEVIAATVTELLASRHHGERWARYWLDVARYADTRDWQAAADLRYPFAYTFRDYVINSLNEDKPYDQYIREQIAADFYTDDKNAPELAALGFLSVGPQYRNNRVERAADRIDVVCRGLMGLTVACARCHDHKYDPVPTEDYYSLYGVFVNTDSVDEYPVVPGQKVNKKQYQAYQKELKAAEQKFLDYQTELRDDAVASLKEKLPTYLLGFFEMSITKQNQIRGAISKFKVIETAMTPLNNHLARELKLKRLENDPILKPWRQSLTASEADFKKSIEKWSASWAKDESIHPLVRNAIDQQQPQSRRDIVAAYGKLFQSTIDRWEKYAADHPDAEKLPAPAWESLRNHLMGQNGWLQLDTAAVLQASRLLGKGRNKIQGFQTAIADVNATHPGAPARAMTVTDAKNITQPFVMLRGEPGRRGDRVPKRFPGILSGDDLKPFVDGSGRRELAEAITAPTNPLTARMIVNRVWSRYFGSGLVRSQDDFGLRSEPPTHPELLDYLAMSLIDNGWSLKWLHESIVTSQTYAQSSQMREDAAAADPSNIWLWRQNRRRLDFEAMRDAMLAVSGKLDRTIGGKSVRLSDTPYTNRRSVYAYVDRNEMDPILRTFDFASPTASAASRAETTVPQQALFGMNHPWVADLSRAIAGQYSDSDLSPAARVNRIHIRILGRAPSDQERQIMIAFLNESNPKVEIEGGTWQFGLMSIGDFSAKAPQAINQVDLTQLPYWTGARYQASEDFPDAELRHATITKIGGHPGPTNELCIVKRWTAPASGTIRIGGTLAHSRDNGEGVIAIVQSGDVQRHFVSKMNEVKTVLPPMKVSNGDIVDFIVAPGETPTSDSHAWRVTIRGVGGKLKDQSWSTVDGFGPPPPPPLDPLAQLAQALLLTNEFLFLD